MPGSGHTYELTNGGAGNRNKTAGDAIFHCHFYPHFAQGMWYHIRIQDTFEKGTVLAVSRCRRSAEPDSTVTASTTRRSNCAAASRRPAPVRCPTANCPTACRSRRSCRCPARPCRRCRPRSPSVAVDRGDFGVLSGRRGAERSRPGSRLLRRPWSTCDDVAAGMNPGFPFWLAGNNCGEIVPGGDPCPQGTVGQRMSTPPLDMLTEAGAELFRHRLAVRRIARHRPAAGTAACRATTCAATPRAACRWTPRTA